MRYSTTARVCMTVGVSAALAACASRTVVCNYAASYPHVGIDVSAYVTAHSTGPVSVTACVKELAHCDTTRQPTVRDAMVLMQGPSGPAILDAATISVTVKAVGGSTLAAGTAHVLLRSQRCGGATYQALVVGASGDVRVVG